MFDDIFEVGAGLVVGTAASAIGASVGRDFASAISDGDKDMETVGTVLGGIAGGALGVSFVDGLFGEDEWKAIK